MKKLFHIIAAYATADYELTPEGLCIVNVRGKDTSYHTMDEMVEKFANIPHVKGNGGIMYSYIFNTETKQKTYN